MPPIETRILLFLLSLRLRWKMRRSSASFPDVLRAQNRLALMPPLDTTMRTNADVVRVRQWLREAEERGAISHEQAAAMHATVNTQQDIILTCKQRGES